MSSERAKTGALHDGEKITNDTPLGDLILYQTEDGRTRIECRFEGETVWLTRAMLAELFQTTPKNITYAVPQVGKRMHTTRPGDVFCKAEYRQIAVQPDALTPCCHA